MNEYNKFKFKVTLTLNINKLCNSKISVVLRLVLNQVIATKNYKKSANYLIKYAIINLIMISK